MQQLFSRILVPVRFNSNTPMLMQKAVEIANCFDSDLHILYVQPPPGMASFFFDGHFTGPLFSKPPRQGREKMAALLRTYQGGLNEGLLMTSSVQEGQWQEEMKSEIISREIDLVLIPRSTQAFPGALIGEININRLSRQTQCPVLTVTPALQLSQLRNIVVPVYDSVPLKKLTVATFLARKFNGIIHLMGGGRGGNQRDKQHLRCITRSYQLIRDYSNVPVHCAARDSGDESASTLSYARQVNADLIVVNPDKESIPRGKWARWLGKYLYRESGIPVLTIAPQP